MAKIVTVNSDVKGDFRNVRLLISATDKQDDSIQNLERLINKLVVLVEIEGDNDN